MRLSEAEVAAVWERFVETEDPDCVDLLVRQYAPLAGYLARRALAKAPPYQDAEDILSYAQHGLLDAIQRFDPSLGIKFETYATRRISGAIIDGQRKQDPLARGTRKAVKVMEAAITQLWDELDREPSVTEIASRAEVSEDSVRSTMLAQKSLAGSLDVDNSVTETRGIDDDAEVGLQMAEVRTRVAERLATLPDRPLAFFLAYYCDRLNLRAAGRSLAMSNDWLREAKAQVIRHVRG